MLTSDHGAATSPDVLKKMKFNGGRFNSRNLLLELNLMKKAWKSYGVNINMKASGLRNVINHGTKVHDGSNYTKRRPVSTNTGHK